MTNNEFGVADRINTAPRYVVSTTLQKANWNNSTLIKSNVIEEIHRLKQQPGGKIGIIGSAKLVHSLLEAGLMDEVQVLMPPPVLGKGIRLFADGGCPSAMKLADSKIRANGVVYLTYQIEPQAQDLPNQVVLRLNMSCVRRVGFEPTRPFGQQFLRLPWLPLHHRPLPVIYIITGTVPLYLF